MFRRALLEVEVADGDDRPRIAANGGRDLDALGGSVSEILVEPIVPRVACVKMCADDAEELSIEIDRQLHESLAAIEVGVGDALRKPGERVGDEARTSNRCARKDQ